MYLSPSYNSPLYRSIAPPGLARDRLSASAPVLEISFPVFSFTYLFLLGPLSHFAHQSLPHISLTSSLSVSCSLFYPLSILPVALLTSQISKVLNIFSFGIHRPGNLQRQLRTLIKSRQMPRDILKMLEAQSDESSSAFHFLKNELNQKDSHNKYVVPSFFIDGIGVYAQASINHLTTRTATSCVACNHSEPRRCRPNDHEHAVGVSCRKRLNLNVL